MKSVNIGYIRKLDHLRFFAMLLVGIYHFYHFQTPWFNGGQDHWRVTKKVFSALIIEGHTGVSLFLVLSGFIFAAIGYKREIDYRGFVMNRILRILPLFGLAIFVAASLSPQGLRAFATSFLFPVSGATGVNYVPITPHLWTIRTEFQFYLLFPFLNTFMGRYGLRYAFGLLLLLVTIRAMIWSSSESEQIKDIAYWSILGRLDQCVIGVIAGCIFSGRAKWKLPLWLKHWSFAPISFLIPLGVTYVFHRMGGFNRLGNGDSAWIYWTDVEALGWGLFILAYVKCDFDWPQWMSKFFGWLGTLSFSLYVNHWLFVHDFPVGKYLPQITNSLTANAAVSFTFVTLPFLVLFSWLTFQVIERPFFEMRRSYLKKESEEQS